jgi:hypothetical protein
MNMKEALDTAKKTYLETVEIDKQIVAATNPQEKETLQKSLNGVREKLIIALINLTRAEFDEYMETVKSTQYSFSRGTRIE